MTVLNVISAHCSANRALRGLPLALVFLTTTSVAKLDDHGKIQSLTLVLTAETQVSGKNVFRHNTICHYSDAGICAFEYSDSSQSIFEDIVSDLPNLSDLAQHGSERINCRLFLPDSDQIYAYGGGSNQLDIYKYSAYHRPFFLLYFGLSIQKNYEERGYNITTSDKENVATGLDSSITYPFCREYMLDKIDEANMTARKTLFFSKTGFDGPYEHIEFYRRGKIFESVDNANYFEESGVIFPRSMILTQHDVGVFTKHTIRKALVNSVINPEIFKPIKPQPGAVVLIHSPKPGGGVSTDRLDLPKTEDLNREFVPGEVVSKVFETTSQPVLIREAHYEHAKEVSHEGNDKTTAPAALSNRSSDSTPTTGGSGKNIALALILIGGCGTGLVIVGAYGKESKHDA